MNRNDLSLLIFFSLFVSANAFYHFFSGNYYHSGNLINFLTALQFAAGIIIAIVLRRKNKTAAPKEEDSKQ